jgi:hypothetical protein
MTRAITIAFIVALSSNAFAQADRFTSTTYLRGYTTPSGSDTTRHLPFFEFITLDADDVGVSGLSIRAALWGQLDLLDVGGNGATGDVSTLYLAWRAPRKHLLEGLSVQLGRHFVAAGPSALDQVDGLSLSYHLPRGFDLALFGGLSTGTRFFNQPWPFSHSDERLTSNWVIGGRLGYSFRDYFTTGLSYRMKYYAGELAHNEIGWDASITPINRLALVTEGVFELTAERLKEIKAEARVEVMRGLDLAAGYRYVSPDLYIPRTSIFAVFGNELHQLIYSEVVWSGWRWLRLSLELGGAFYAQACTSRPGDCEEGSAELSALVRGDVKLDPLGRYRLIAEAERKGTPEGGFSRIRLGTRLNVWRTLSVIADLDLVLLDKALNPTVVITEDPSRVSFTGSAYLSYAFNPNLSLLAGGSGAVTPVYKNAGSFMVRLFWAYDGKPQATEPTQVSRSGSSASYLMGGAR